MVLTVLQQLEQKVEEALDEEIGEVVQAAEIEVSIANNSSPPSLFAKYLCLYLDLRKS